MENTNKVVGGVMRSRNKEEDAFIHLIDKIFEYGGYDIGYKEALDIPEFYSKYTWTQEQSDAFKVYMAAYLKKKFKYSKYIIDRQIAFFNLSYGLRIVE